MTLRSQISEVLTFKFTIINGQWVYAPAPSTDLTWLKRHPSLPVSPDKRTK